MINKDISNNLFDEIYRTYNINGYISDRAPNDEEKEAICKTFYLLLPLILNDMSDRQRDVIALAYGYNQTQTDIARTLGINQSNVSIHLKGAHEVINKYFNIIFKATLWGLRYEKTKD